MTTYNINSVKTAATGLNDGNLTTDVDLGNGTNEAANNYEGAGVTWVGAQNVGTFKFINGSWDGNGSFATDMRIQKLASNGVTWTDITTWTLSPSYSYTNTTANITYTFTGAPVQAWGMRVVGKLTITGHTSKRARVREVMAYANQGALVLNASEGAAKVLARPEVHLPIGWTFQPGMIYYTVYEVCPEGSLVLTLSMILVQILLMRGGGLTISPPIPI